MLFKRHVLEGLAAGRVTLAFRRWRRPTVREGGQLRTPIGVLAIGEIRTVDETDIREGDACRAGYTSRSELLADLRAAGGGPIHRIALRLAGPDPRVRLRRTSRLAAAELAEVQRRLQRLDAASRRGPWTMAVLRLIGERPGARAADLAASSSRDTRAFKIDVRKLKELGLTESLETGYRLSPRGRTVLARLGAKPRRIGRPARGPRKA